MKNYRWISLAIIIRTFETSYYWDKKVHKNMNMEFEKNFSKDKVIFNVK